MNEFEISDIIISIAPSYWADIPGLSSLSDKAAVEERVDEINEFCITIHN